MNNPWVGRLKIWAGIFAVFMVLLVVVRVGPFGGGGGGSADSPDSTTPTTVVASTDSTVPTTETTAATTTTSTTTTVVTVDTLPPVQLDLEMEDTLSITFSNVSCPDVVVAAGGEVIPLSDGTVTYLMKDESLVPVGDGGRRWTDAMALPVVHTDDSGAVLDEVILAICQGPNFGGMVDSYFANNSVGGWKWVDLNPWLTPYVGSEDLINDLALQSVGTIDGKDGYFVKPSYQQLAEFTAELLIRYKLLGPAAEQSTANYHLVAGGQQVSNFPEVGLNPTQENLPALMLMLDQKTGECLSKIGFNLGDKRLEIFSCSPPTCTVNCGSGGGTTTTTVVCGNKNHFDPVTGQCVPNLVTDSTTPAPPTSVPTSAPPTTLACVYGTHRDPATGQCVSNTPPAEDPAPDPIVPDGNNTGPLPSPGV